MTEATNVLREKQMFLKQVKRSWPFRCEPSSDHAAPTAAL